MRFQLTFTVLLSALLISISGLVAAQALPYGSVPGALSAELRLARLDGMALAVTPAVGTHREPTKAPLLQKHEELRRGRALIAAGTSLVLSGAAIVAALGLRPICNDRVMIAPFAAGVPVVGAGLAMVMRGGFTLTQVPTEYRRRHRPNPGMRVGMAFGVIALGMLSQAVMWGVSVPEILDCSIS